MTQEKRHFTRIEFKYPIELVVNDLRVKSKLLDLSLHGALVQTPEKWPGHITQLELRVPLADTNPDDIIVIQTQLCHEDDHALGLEFLRMDLDSATFLHRLLELNLGDEQLLHRQFKELIKA